MGLSYILAAYTWEGRRRNWGRHALRPMFSRGRRRHRGPCLWRMALWDDVMSRPPARCAAAVGLPKGPWVAASITRDRKIGQERREEGANGRGGWMERLRGPRGKGWEQSRLIGARYSRMGTRGGYVALPWKKKRCGLADILLLSIDWFFRSPLSSITVPLFLSVRWVHYEGYGRLIYVRIISIVSGLYIIDEKFTPINMELYKHGVEEYSLHSKL